LRPGQAAIGGHRQGDAVVLEVAEAAVDPDGVDVVLHFRSDCGFGVPAMYDACERLRVWYTFGLSANAVLQR
jgi:hypothetical protein